MRVVEFTDPGCPWAFSAEPFRLRLKWTFGDQLAWERRMVVLAEDEQEYVDKGLTPEVLAPGMAMIAQRHGMPIVTEQRDRMAGTAPACRAVVGARLHDAEHEDALLRELRLQAMGGRHLDEDATLRAAAEAAGVDPDAAVRWAREDEDVRLATEEDKAAARHPLPSALALSHKLAPWSGGLRYTCPSLEVSLDGTTTTAPGFQPFESYDVVLANLAPDLERRPAPESPQEALAWAGRALATQEVAVLLGVTRDEAREQLAGVADERSMGTDALWTLR